MFEVVKSGLSIAYRWRKKRIPIPISVKCATYRFSKQTFFECARIFIGETETDTSYYFGIVFSHFAYQNVRSRRRRHTAGVTFIEWKSIANLFVRNKARMKNDLIVYFSFSIVVVCYVRKQSNVSRRMPYRMVCVGDFFILLLFIEVRTAFDWWW